MDPSSIPPCVYQFRVAVQGISSLIWRRLLIRSDMSLATLHATLRIVFARSDVHLYCLHIHGREYGSTRRAGPCFDIDPRQMPLADLHLHRGERFTYVYNFIDHWESEIRLEAVLPGERSGRSSRPPRWASRSLKAKRSSKACKRSSCSSK